MSTPAWLSQALVGWSGLASPGEVGLRPGQVLACETRQENDGEDFSRLVLVLDVDQEEPVVTVCLVTNETDLAIDTDLIVPAATSGLPLDIVVETNLVGNVWKFQLVGDRVLGSLPPEVLDVVAALEAGNPPEGGDLTRGLPMSGADDPRRNFRESELADLKRLTAECERHLLDGGLGAPVPDHGPLLRRISTDTNAAHAWLLDATTGFANGSLASTPAVAEALLDAVSMMGADPVLRALLAGVTNDVLCGLSAGPPGRVPVVLPPALERSHPDPKGLQAILSDQLSGGRSVMMLATEGYMDDLHLRNFEVRAQRRRCVVNCVDRRIGVAA
jgi:hypothetical protein